MNAKSRVPIWRERLGVETLESRFNLSTIGSTLHPQTRLTTAGISSNVGKSNPLKHPKVQIKQNAKHAPHVLFGDTAILSSGSTSIDVTSYSVLTGGRMEWINGKPDIGYMSASGADIEYKLTVAAAGKYQLNLGVASPHSNSFDLLVNGSVQARYAFNATNSWTNYTTTSQTITLAAGANTIRVNPTAASQFNINALSLSPITVSTGVTTTIGASSTLVPVTSYSSISNSKLEYLNGQPDIGYVSATGAYVEYALNMQTAGNYSINVGEASPTASSFNLSINGTRATTYNNASTDSWTNFSNVSHIVYLPAGAITLRFTANAGTQYNIGSINIAAVPPPAPAPAGSPSVPSVTISTQWMTSFNQLNIFGSSSNDSIYVSEAGNTITVTADGTTKSFAGQYGNIVIKSNGGNDTITVDPSVSIDTLVYGATGNSVIKNQTQAMATVVTVGGGTNFVQGNGFNSSLWVNATDNVKATSTEQNAGDLHVVSNFWNGASTLLAGQNLSDPAGTGSTTRLVNASLWGTGPTMSDVNQGQVGDCYYLGVIQTQAFSNSNALRQLAVDLGDGTYAVQFKRGGTTTYLRVDGDLPANGPYAGGLEYAHPGSSGDLWAPILEKAYAEYRTGAWTYNSTGWGYFGDVAADFGIHYTPFRGQSDSDLYNTLQGALAGGKGITVGTNASITAGAPLIESHQYTVTNVWKNTSGTGYVTLRNPWGIDGAGQDSNPNDALVTMTVTQLQQNLESGMIF